MAEKIDFTTKIKHLIERAHELEVERERVSQQMIDVCARGLASTIRAWKPKVGEKALLIALGPHPVARLLLVQEIHGTYCRFAKDMESRGFWSFELDCNLLLEVSNLVIVPPRGMGEKTSPFSRSKAGQAFQESKSRENVQGHRGLREDLVADEQYFGEARRFSRP